LPTELFSVDEVLKELHAAVMGLKAKYEVLSKTTGDSTKPAV
jgi:hypothetical protein